jgi:hypothetical protein
MIDITFDDVDIFPSFAGQWAASMTIMIQSG